MQILTLFCDKLSLNGARITKVALEGENRTW